MKRNAFTLIELLAVIVILAIIALIAVPIVINIINDAKEESLKRSVQNYLDAATEAITKENLKTKYNPDECKIQDNGDLICSENGNELNTSNGTKELVIDIKGKKPGSGTIKLKDGKITNIINLSLNDTKFMFDSKGNIVINENTQIAGLYDENNNLLATWDELVNVYKLDITKDYNRIEDQGTMYSVLNNNDKLKNGKILIIEENAVNNKIGNRAFEGCKSLTSVIIPNSVTSIGDRSFHECTNLTNIEIPNTVMSIGQRAFYRCSSLKSIIIPNNITSIGVWTFYECTSLENITLGNSVTSIEDSAFFGCSSLTNITIPSSVTDISFDAFKNCSSLTSVTFEDTTGWYKDYLVEEDELVDVTDPVENAKLLKNEKESSSSGPSISLDEDFAIRLIKK